MKEEQQKSAIYDMLSEADREALAFGYQMQKKEQERKEKRKKRNRRLKHVSAAVVALVFVGGIGFSTEASRRWIFQVGDAIVENFGVSIKNNFVEEENRIRIWNENEETALQEIKQKVDISPVKLMYLPQGMRFLSYDIDTESLCANIFYEYRDSMFIVYMFNNETENVFYYHVDEKLKEKEKIVTEQNIIISVYESEYKGAKSCMASFEHDGDYYYCVSSIEYSEIKKILKYLVVF